MLKEMLSEIENAMKEYDVDGAVNAMYKIADNYGLIEDLLFDNIIDRELIDDMVSARLEATGFEGVKIMLDGIHSLNANYYYLNGYGNLEDLSISKLEVIYDDIKTTLADEISEEELEEE